MLAVIGTGALVLLRAALVTFGDWLVMFWNALVAVRRRGRGCPSMEMVRALPSSALNTSDVTKMSSGVVGTMTTRLGAGLGGGVNVRGARTLGVVSVNMSVRAVRTWSSGLWYNLISRLGTGAVGEASGDVIPESSFVNPPPTLFLRTSGKLSVLKLQDLA